MWWWNTALATFSLTARPSRILGTSLVGAGTRAVVLYEVAADNMDGGSGMDILNLDARTLSEQLRSRQISAEKLMQITLDRIDELNPSLNALISLRSREELLEEALSADATDRKGWLHGIPIAIKDMANAKGLATTMGGAPLFCDDSVADENDAFVQRLVDAGAIVIGKTNTPEHGMGSHTFNKKWGTTVNPYNTDRSAGGSSGGAAVAVSARMLCVADGSDMMGSLRNPAGWNNIYSLRPTAGMIEKDDDDDVNPLAYPISTAGPMARTPLDLASLLETMSGSFDASTVSTDPDLRGMSIAWLADWGGAYPLEPGILQLCQDALTTVFADSGEVSVDYVSEPPMKADELWDSWTTIRSKIISSNLAGTYGMDALISGNAPIKEEATWEAKRGFALTDEQVSEATIVANRWSRTVSKFFERYDALALPTAQVWPFPIEWTWPKSVAGKEMDTYHRWMEVVVPGTLAGLPCVTIPAGFRESGLPMGIQLAGPRGSDSKLLSLAQFYHSRTNWPTKRPPDCRF